CLSPLTLIRNRTKIQYGSVFSSGGITMEDPSALARRLILAATRMDGAYYYFARHSGVPENLLALFYALADGKPHSQKEICEDWLIPKTTINTVVKEQVAAGHLTLRTGEGREKIICLT